MEQYIINILKTQIWKVLHWNFDKARTVPNGLRFSVNGFLHHGDVEVTCDTRTDSFTVKLINLDNSISQTKADIRTDDLVQTIDDLVENRTEYSRRVNELYSQNRIQP